MTAIQMSVEYQALQRFADSITPRNWHVVLHPRDYRYIPGTLNIWLQVLNKDEAIEFFSLEGLFMGRVWGPVWFTRLSSIMGRIPEARQAFERFGDGSIGRAHIQVCPHTGDLRFIVVHELAHIAVTRCTARKLRPHKGDNVFVIEDAKEARHRSKLFRKALSRMILRTERQYGRNAGTEALWEAYLRYTEKRAVPHSSFQRGH